MNPAALCRTLRRLRRFSQREFAARAGLPASTVDRIESGRSDPRLSTVTQLLAPVGFRLAPLNHRGRELVLDDDTALRDRGGRRPPAHLETWLVTDPTSWWGWGSLAWWPEDPKVPEFTFARRRRTSWTDPYYALDSEAT